MTGKLQSTVLLAPGGAYSDLPGGEPLSFVLSFGVIALALLLDCIFRKLGG
ncbi:MAG: hypothetical protein GXO66_07740 [Euryarchaeota archaeon]|nr:hypothetical protein [Euryarchaeota archaeon]